VPQSKQAKKRVRQNEKRRIRNRARKSELKTVTKKILTAVEQGAVAEAVESFRDLQKKADKAAKAKTIHPNKAARRKSRLQKRINALQKQQQAAQ
jgi:small subunit ribosomal protein S20